MVMRPHGEGNVSRMVIMGSLGAGSRRPNGGLSPQPANPKVGRPLTCGEGLGRSVNGLGKGGGAQWVLLGPSCAPGPLWVVPCRLGMHLLLSGASMVIQCGCGYLMQIYPTRALGSKATQGAQVAPKSGPESGP